MMVDSFICGREGDNGWREEVPNVVQTSPIKSCVEERSCRLDFVSKQKVIGLQEPLYSTGAGVGSTAPKKIRKNDSLSSLR